MSLNITLNGLDNILQKLDQLIDDVQPQEVKVANYVEYAALVGKSRTQARVHRQRWISDIEAIEAENRTKLANFDADTLMEMAQRLVDLMQQEPAPRGTYQRTGRYRNSFEIIKVK